MVHGICREGEYPKGRVGTDGIGAIRAHVARERLGINVVGIIINGKIDVTLDPQKPLPEGGILIVIGANDVLEKFDSKKKL